MAAPPEGTVAKALRLRQRALDNFIGLFVDRPHTCLGSGILTLLVLVGISIATGCMNLTLDQKSAWLVHKGEFTEKFNAWQMSRDAAKDSNRRLNKESIQRNLLLLYSANGGGNIFTPARLQNMCELESILTNSRSCPQGGGDADGLCPAYSPVASFYGNGTAAALAGKSCPLLSQQAVDNVLQDMKVNIAALGSGSKYANIVGISYPQANVTGVSRSNFQLAPDDHKEETADKTVIDDLFKKFDPPMEYGFMRSAFQGDKNKQVEYKGLKVRVFYDLDEMQRMIAPDFTMAALSVVLVLLAIWAHLGSLFLACFSMFQILASLPVAGIFYRKMFMVDYFEFLHILVVYLVLGIGADDIFVLLDTWRHIKDELGIEPLKPTSRSKMHQGLKSTWVRAASAMFNTSFTTGVAFLSMSVSKVMPMRTCGWYAAICIFINFILTICFTPSVLMVHHFRLSGKRCCCPDMKHTSKTVPNGGTEEASESSPSAAIGNPQGAQEPEQSNGKAQEAEDGGAVQKRTTRRGGGCFSGVVEKALSKGFLPLMLYKIGPVRPFPLVTALGMAAVAAQGAYFTSELEPPAKAEVWFPSNHMWNDLDKYISDTYYAPDWERYAKMWIVWGIKGIDFSTFDQYQADTHPGTVEYDSSFDLSTKQAQDALLGTCKRLRALSCHLEGCKAAGYDKLVMRTGKNPAALACTLEDFQLYLTNRSMGAIPTGSQFVMKLSDFRETDPSSYGKPTSPLIKTNYREDVHIGGGARLLHVALRFRSTLPNEEPYGSIMDVRKLVADFVQDEKGRMPAGMESIMVASEQFAQSELGYELVQGLFSGCAIAGPVTFVVLLFSTRNIIMALYAVISVGAIVVCVLGFCKSAMGWGLGIGEAVAGVIVIGYSVDYVIHLAHIYCEAASHGMEKREERAAFAVKNMGSTVFAGAITTAGSACVMFFCFLTFFYKMALLICMTIFYSFLFAFFFFLSLCFLVGPEKWYGDLLCGKILLPEGKKEPCSEDAAP